MHQIEVSGVKDGGNAPTKTFLQAAIDKAKPGDTVLLAPGMVSDTNSQDRGRGRQNISFDV